MNACKIQRDSPDLKELHIEKCKYLWSPTILMTSFELQVSMTLLIEASGKRGSLHPEVPLGVLDSSYPWL